MTGKPNVVPLDSHRRARARAASDGASLDVLAQLFEQLARDVTVPACVRAEIARLRIPTLRAAQLSGEFLVRRAHPARRLLDAIGAAALGLDDAAGEEDATVREISAAVHGLLTDFGEELGPFEIAADRLARFLAERTRQEDEGARPMIQLVVRREEDEAPLRAAEEEVARRLRARLWVPAPVRAMLCGPWVHALAAAHRNHGEPSAQWHSLVRTMDDLLWSVEPKASGEGRRRLGTLLPGLVEAINAGLESAQAGEAERADFLSALVDCHAHAMKAGLRGMVLVPEPAAGLQVAASKLARSSTTVGERRVEEIRIAAPGEADAGDDEVARLAPGAWIELDRGARAPARKRLAWASPLTGARLFIGVSPASAGVVASPEALAQMMRCGEARIVDGAPLVERTLASLVARLSPQG